MPARSYGQHCPIARSLERFGDRWTLLIVRELLLEPRRFSDLERALAGIPPALLAGRLERLESDGIVESGRDGAGVTWTLTVAGQALEDVVLAMLRWGSRYLGEPVAGERLLPTWPVLPLRGAMRGLRSDASAVLEIRARGSEAVRVHVSRRGAEVVSNPRMTPDLVLEVEDPRALLTVLDGRTLLHQAVASGAITAEGDLSRLQLLEEGLAGLHGDEARASSS